MSWIEEPRGSVLLAGQFTQQQVDDLRQGSPISVRATMDNTYYRTFGSVSESPQTKEPHMK